MDRPSAARKQIEGWARGQRTMEYARVPGAILASGALAVGFLDLARGQQIHRNGFEAREIAWRKGTADAHDRELAHEITDTTAHRGQYCEHLQLTAEQGSSIYYYYPMSRAPICDDLTASVCIKANRPGLQLMARLVLPKERNPANLQE